jgi:RNA polymerase sigma-70 factor (ECF subfamily)
MRESAPREAHGTPPHESNHSIHQGKIRAFELVYKANSELVHRICSRMLRNPIEAEDAAQDVFVQVFLKLHTFRGESALSSWLYRLTTNLVLMRFRKQKNERPVCEFLDDDRALHCDVGKPDLHLTGAVDRVDLQAAIDRLPDGYRAVFVLHDVQGYAHKEIANLFGYSIGNSKCQLHKARRRLRKLLGGRPGKAALSEAHLNPSVGCKCNRAHNVTGEETQWKNSSIGTPIICRL